MVPKVFYVGTVYGTLTVQRADEQVHESNPFSSDAHGKLSME